MLQFPSKIWTGLSEVKVRVEPREGATKRVKLLKQGSFPLDTLVLPAQVIVLMIWFSCLDRVPLVETHGEDMYYVDLLNLIYCGLSISDWTFGFCT